MTQIDLQVLLEQMFSKIKDIDQNVRDLRTEQKHDISEIYKAVDKQKLMCFDKYSGKPEVKNLREKIDEINSAITWARRLIIGLVITAIMGVVIKIG